MTIGREIIEELELIDMLILSPYLRISGKFEVNIEGSKLN